MDATEKVATAARNFKERYTDFLYDVRELRGMRQELEEAKAAADQLRQASLKEGISDQEFEELDQKADEAEAAFTDLVGFNLDDALDLCDELDQGY